MKLPIIAAAVATWCLQAHAADAQEPARSEKPESPDYPTDPELNLGLTWPNIKRLDHDRPVTELVPELILKLAPDQAKRPPFLFRFLYIRSFHDPIMIDVFPDGDRLEGHLSVLGFTDDTGWHLKRNEAFPIDPHVSENLKSTIADKEFWAPLSDAERELSNSIIDGSHWLLTHANEPDKVSIELRTPAAMQQMIAEVKARPLPGRDPDEYRDFAKYVELGELLLRSARALPKGDWFY